MSEKRPGGDPSHVEAPVGAPFSVPALRKAIKDARARARVLEKEVAPTEDKLRVGMRAASNAWEEWAVAQTKPFGEFRGLSEFEGGFYWEGDMHYGGVPKSYHRTVMVSVGPNSEGRMVLERALCVEEVSGRHVGIEISRPLDVRYEIRIGAVVATTAGNWPEFCDRPEAPIRSVIVSPTSIDFDKQSTSAPETAPDFLTVASHELDLVRSAAGRLMVGFTPHGNWKTA